MGSGQVGSCVRSFLFSASSFFSARQASGAAYCTLFVLHFAVLRCLTTPSLPRAAGWRR